MLNMIRADFYRLFRTRGFWITQIFIVVFLFIIINFSAIGTIGVNSGEHPKLMDDLMKINWNGVTAVFASQQMSGMFLYFILPLLGIVIGNDFTKNTYKNILTVGVSRYKYFFTKFISYIMVLVSQLILTYVIIFAIGSILNGTGDVSIDFIVDTFKIMGLQVLYLIAITTISCIILFITKSNTVSVIVAIIAPLIITTVQLLNPKNKLLQAIDFQPALDKASTLDFSTLKVVTIGAILTIILGSILITQVFKRQEL